ncbi:MAG: hypothetical protein Q9195_000705 [Heterodermia aff. obscurata]
MENRVYASNAAPGPTLAATEINATQTSINDRVVHSPAGFFAYPSVKIINVPAVIQANGELACTTASTYQLKCPDPIDSATFSGINSHVQAYYGGLSSSTQTSTDRYTYSRWSTLPGSTFQQVQVTKQTTFTATGTAIITNITHAATSFSTTEIIFPTPYLYFPSRGKTEVQNTGDLPDIVGIGTSALDKRALSTTRSRTSTKYDTLVADYGYIPQVVIDSMANDPEYIRQYPSLASCLPGGPSIIPIKDHEPWINVAADGCAWAAPEVLESVPDLTTSSGATVKGVGCFHPGNCATMAKTTAVPSQTMSVELPESTKPPTMISSDSAISSSTRKDKPAKSSSTKPISMSSPVLVFGHSANDQSTSQTYNPTETAKPATNTGGALTAGGDIVLFASSSGLPAIVIANPTGILQSAKSDNVITTAGHTPKLIPSASAVEIAGQTLTLASSAKTILGTSVSLGSSGLVIGTSTIPLPTPKPSKASSSTKTTQGLGAIIAGAFGPHESTVTTGSAGSSGLPANGSSTSPLAFLGGTTREKQGLRKVLGFFGVMAGLFII